MIMSRSQYWISSSLSLAYRMTLIPLLVTCREMYAYRSLLAPTSTPLAGSARRRTFVSNDSHLPTTTFCWLPPDSVRTGVSRLCGLDGEHLDDALAFLRILRGAG